jgi:thiamine biosynthesis lipoprotein ApbE
VCTSAHYNRSRRIGNRWYSHIINPSTCWPDNTTASVTVVAPTAMEADGWATALSVLGRRGLGLIPADSGIDAILIVGTRWDQTWYATEGFQRYLASGPDIPGNMVARPRRGGAGRR